MSGRSFREIVGLINSPTWRLLNTFSSNPLRSKGPMFPNIQVVPLERIPIE